MLARLTGIGTHSYDDRHRRRYWTASVHVVMMKDPFDDMTERYQIGARRCVTTAVGGLG